MRASNKKLTKSENILRAVRYFLFISVLIVTTFVQPVSASPLYAPQPSVDISLPESTMLGTTFNLSVFFDNIDSTDAGYGPYVDLYLPYSGVDGSSVNDGLSYVTGSARYLSSQPREWVYSCPAGTNITHPLTGLSVTCPAAPSGFVTPFTWQLVVLEYPFGSFTADQPVAEITLSATMSNMADLGVDLPVRASSGFRFGDTPTGTNGPIVGSLTAEGAHTIYPTLLEMTKTYNGPEGETATGPNYPRQYTLTVDVADGQPINNLTITDLLPDDLQYLRLVSATPAGYTIVDEPTLGAAQIAPDNDLVVSWPTITGGPGTNDAQVVFEFFVPEFRAGGLPVLNPATGACEISTNQSSVNGTWDPIDPGDGEQNAPASATFDLNVCALAIQKNINIVTDNNHSGYTPADVLEYTYAFQVSDYFTLGGSGGGSTANTINIIDVVSDGQLFNYDAYGTGDDATLSVTDRDGTASGYFFSGVDGNLNITSQNPHEPNHPGACGDGSTTLDFDVSNQLAALGGAQNDAVLTGGCVGNSGCTDDPTDPDPLSAATGSIRYQTVIQNSYSCTVPSGDDSVDQGDHVSNTVVASADVLDNETGATLGELTASNGSASEAEMVQGSLVKSIYARNGVVGPVTQYAPGDTITYRLQYTLPTSSVEAFDLIDFLPLPVLFANDSNADGATGDVWTWDTPASCPTSPSSTPPASGHFALGPSDTFHCLLPPSTPSTPPDPSLTVDGVSNSLQFHYGNYDNEANDSSDIDLLFTLTVSNEPFDDELYLTNQVRAVFENSFLDAGEQDEIVQIELTQPVIEVGDVTKGIVKTDRTSGATFSPTTTAPAGVSFTTDYSTYPSCPAFSGTISSTGIATSPINSNLSGLDAGDHATIAIVVENTGTGINGAFDVSIKDTMPAGTTYVPNSLCVANGAGTSLPYTNVGGGSGLFDQGIELTDPSNIQGSLSAYDGTSGQNIAVITYDVLLADTVTYNQALVNTATLFNYAGNNGGPDHTETDLTDTAQITTRTLTGTKTRIATEIDTSLEVPSRTVNTNSQATIGETIDYRVTITVPEEMVANLNVYDTLDAGLAFVKCNSITASSGLATDLDKGAITDSFEAACPTTPESPAVNPVISGSTITFNLGNVVNSNRDNAVTETITIEYQVVVLNVIGNQQGTALNNSARIRSGTSNIVTSLSAPNTTVVEPAPTVAKSATINGGSVGLPGDPVEYIITIRNPSGTNVTDAFDAQISDALPRVNPGTDDRSLITTPSIFSVTDSLGVLTSANFSLTGSDSGGWLLQSAAPFDIPVNRVIAITIRGNLLLVDPPAVSANQLIRNTADMNWTSLPGSPGQRSIYNVNSTERTGADGAGSGLNNYATSSNGDIRVTNVIAAKYLIDPSTGTILTGQDVRVGDIIGYRVELVVPRDVFLTNLNFADQLDAGLAYVDCLKIEADDTALTTSVTNGFSCSNPNISITNSGGNIGIGFGNIQNTDLVNSHTITLEYRAVVLNTTSINRSDDKNNAITASFSVNSGTTTRTASAPNVNVVEPLLVVDKSVNTSTGDANDTVTFTIWVTSSSITDTTTAYDVVMQDVLPAGLTYNTGTLTHVSGLAPTTGPTYDTGTRTFSAGWSSFPIGTTSQFTFQATLDADVYPEQVITNTAGVTYTSLPGDQTGAKSSYNSSSCERTGDPTTLCDGSTGTFAQNDYQHSDGAVVTVNPTDMAKELTDTSVSSTTGNNLTIGEIATFKLTVDLPEGETPSLVVTDLIPSGMAYVANSYQLDTTDFNGTLPTPTITPVTYASSNGADGEDLVVTFGSTITVVDDNDPANNSFDVILQAIVLDTAANHGMPTATTLSNVGRVQVGTGTPVDSPPVVLTVVEPRIVTVKSVSPTSGVEAGDTLTYTVSFTNNGTSTAYDVTALDTIAQGVSYDTGSASCVDQSSVSVGVSVTVGGGGTTLSFDGSPAGSWDIPVSGSITCTYTATALSSIYLNGSHTNTIDADWTSLDGVVTGERVYDDTISRPSVDGTQDTDDAVFTTDPITLDKAVNKSTATIGEEVTYTLTIGGPNGQIRSLVVDDTLAAGWVYTGMVSITGLSTSVTSPVVTGVNDGSASVNLTWDFGDVEKTSTSAVITYTARVANVSANAAGDTLSNEATLNYHLDSGTPATELSDDTETDIVEPNMVIDKEFDTAAPYAYATPGDADQAYDGQTIAITWRLQNTGTSTAYDVIVQDVLPNAVYTSITALTTPTGFTFSTSDDGTNTTVTYTATQPFAVDASADFVFTAVVGDITAGTSYPNTATVTQATTLPGSDPNERDEPDVSDSDPFVGVGPDIGVTKTDNVTSAQPGDTLNYAIHVSNTGTYVTDVTGVVVTETVPNNTAYTGTGWTCSPNNNAGSTCTYPAFPLAAGASTDLTFTVQVITNPPAGEDTIYNPVSVTDDGTHGQDSDPTNNSDDDTDTLDAASDLSITKTDGRTQVTAGLELTYTLTISNTGDQQATGVLVTDTLPAYMTAISASDSGDISAAPVITWPTFNLDAGDSVTRTLTVQVNDPLPDGLTTLLNTATVGDDGSNGADPTPENNTATDTDYALAEIGKVLTGTNQDFTAGQNVAVGEILTYTTTFEIVPAVDEETPSVVEDLTLTDTLDQGLAFVDCTSITASDPGVQPLTGTFDTVCGNPVVSTEPASSTNPTDDGRKVVFDFGDVQNSSTSVQTITVTYRAVVLDAAEVVRDVTLGNSAQWNWLGGSLTAAAPSVVVVEPSLDITKAASTGILINGQTITYTLTIGHIAGESNTNAYDLELTDTVPAGLTYVPGSLQITGGYSLGAVINDAAAPALSIVWPSYPLGEQSTVQYQVTVGPISYGRRITNTARLAWTSLPGDYIPPSSENTVPQSSYNPLSIERYYDPASLVDVYGTFAELTLRAPNAPLTGFAPGMVQVLPEQSDEKKYSAVGDIWLEIPKLGIKLPVTGIPFVDNQWDLTWLAAQAGYLEGTAFPTQAGNSVVTAHVYLPDGQPGPFIQLDQLMYGDQIIIHAYGQKYIYEVREMQQVYPQSQAIFKHSEYPVLTLVTCQGYDEYRELYTWRYYVRAVQVKIEN